MNRMKINRILLILTAVFTGLYAAPDICSGQIEMTLDKAVGLAMKNSPDIQRTKLDLERNSQLLKAQQAANKSNFSLTLEPFTYSSDLTFDTFLSAWSKNEKKESKGSFRITQPIVQTGGSVSLINNLSWQDSYSDYNDKRNKQFSNNLYLSYTQPIFTYNQLSLEMKELELDLENAQLTFAIQELSIERQVAQTFYNAYESKMNLDIATEEQKNQEDSYNIIKNKVEADLAALEELYQAELNLASSKSSVQNSRVTLENSLDILKQLIGMSLNEEITIKTDTTHKHVPVDLNMAVTSGLENRKELRQNKINIENAQFDLIRTSAQNEFKGSVTLTYGLIGTNEDFVDMYENQAKNQTVGLSVNIPLWDWGEKKSRIKASEATIQRQELTYDNEITSIQIEIRATYRKIQNQALQIEIARQNVKNAELTYDINLERYKYGDLTSMDLSLYQTQLSEKKTALVSALVDYRLALLDLKIQSLWDFEKDRPVFPNLNK